MTRATALPPSLDDIDSIARKTLATVPDSLLRHCREVVIRVEELPDGETVEELKLASPFDLLGLYRGVALNHKSVLDTPDGVDMIFLYRRPILDCWCETESDLSALVRHVLIHEIGHHFGFSDEDMERIEMTA
jgi:predicted Zn-dependent protease with MMP-like domain